MTLAAKNIDQKLLKLPKILKSRKSFVPQQFLPNDCILAISVHLTYKDTLENCQNAVNYGGLQEI